MENYNKSGLKEAEKIWDALENDTPEKELEREARLKTVIESASPRDIENHELFKAGLANLSGSSRKIIPISLIAKVDPQTKSKYGR